MLVKKVLVLDSLDKVIIKNLLKKPRITMTALGGICNISDVAIKKRVNKLEEFGIIIFKAILKEGVDINAKNPVVQIVEQSDYVHSDSINEIPG